MILAKEEEVDEILKNLYATIGSSTNAQGIVFAIPVDEAIGLS